MNQSEVKKMVLSWGTQCISSDFSEEHMNENISLLGLDSVDVVEFCDYLKAQVGIEVDFDWVMEFETLNDLVNQVAVQDRETQQPLQ